MTPEVPATPPSFAGILAETIDVLLRAGREMSSPGPNLPALQEMVVSSAQVLMAVRIGVAKLEGATACPTVTVVAPFGVVDLNDFRAARAGGAARP